MAPRRPGIDQFWQKADDSGSGQHPLERELDEHVDALARYRRLIAEAESNGRDEAADILMQQLHREEASVDRLRQALAADRSR
jgi:bacterioferritin (cytochrome b1)